MTCPQAKAQETFKPLDERLKTSKYVKAALKLLAKARIPVDICSPACPSPASVHLITDKWEIIYTDDEEKVILDGHDISEMVSIKSIIMGADNYKGPRVTLFLKVQ